MLGREKFPPVEQVFQEHRLKHVLRILPGFQTHKTDTPHQIGVSVYGLIYFPLGSQTLTSLRCPVVTVAPAPGAARFPTVGMVQCAVIAAMDMVQSAICRAVLMFQRTAVGAVAVGTPAASAAPMTVMPRRHGPHGKDGDRQHGGDDGRTAGTLKVEFHRIGPSQS